MQKKSFSFSTRKTTCYFDAVFSDLDKIVARQHSILITDENLIKLHPGKFRNWKTIVIRAGEQFKTQATVNTIIDRLIEMGADRKSFLIGVGGGVVTDITGYAASIYMRGIRFGFVPTSILGMVDASVGGKNGVDVGIYKNLVGLIRQPEFLLYDVSLLKTLPHEEWVSGFAEIIKHACIRDAALFRELEKSSIADYKKDKAGLVKLIRKNVLIKASIVHRDEFEKGERRLLNFGHTLGHAIENMYQLSHGKAVAIGMVAAAILSEQFSSFRQTSRIIQVLQAYGLPTKLEFESRKIFEVLKMDKKKERNTLNYVLLNRIGDAMVKAIPVDDLETLLHSIDRAR